MATTNATLTLTSADLTGDALSLSTTATLTTSTSATTGLSETTGVARKNYPSASADQMLIDASDYTSDKAHKLYIKNCSTTASNTVQIHVTNPTGPVRHDLGTLYGGDWAFLPFDADKDIEISTTGSNVTVEYMLIFE